MAKTHDVGPFYWQVFKYPVKLKGIFDRAETQEIEEPYRGGVGWAIRMPFTKRALVVGKWTARYSESNALTRAIIGRKISQDDVDWDKIRGLDLDV